ncbi:MAG: alpha/beta hydrolase [Anaerolineae bacterium]|nr:alpha/beta hydrolase [Anaerolineae bacterium]
MLKRFLLLMLLVMVAHSSVAAQGDYAEPSALADEDGKFVMVNEASVYYLDRGPADGEPVVLLHGFLGSVIDWTNTIPALTEAGYRVIAFDRPPFGLSDKRTDLDYSTKAMSELTAGLLDELEITQAALVGHSAGGLVAADFTLRYPDRVTRLVLVDAAIGLMDADAGEDSNQAAGAFGFLSNVDPDSPLAQAAVSAFFNSDFAASLMTQSVNDASMLDSSLLELRMRGLRVRGWEGGLLAFTRDAQKPESQFDLDLLRNLEVPTLLIWGEADAIVPIAVGERLREFLPDETWITYPDVGHIPMDEATAQMNADLLKFLQSS